MKLRVVAVLVVIAFAALYTVRVTLVPGSRAARLVVEPSYLEDPLLRADRETPRDDACVLEYVLRNDGGISLQISTVWGSCGCLSHSLSSDQIAPGDTSLLTVRVDRALNLQRKILIRVETESPQKKVVELTALIAAKNAIPHLDGTNPYAVEFSGDIRPGTERSFTIGSFEYQAEPWLVSFESQLQGVELNNVRAYRLMIRPVRVSNEINKLTLRTNHPETPRIAVDILRVRGNRG